MKLRVCERSWSAFLGDLLRVDDRETAGLVFAERLESDVGAVLCARALIPMPESAYLIRHIDRLRLDPIALNRLIRPARDRGWSVFTIHTHPGATRPWFSWADDEGDRRLMPSFDVQMDGPHGSLVAVRNTDLAASVLGRWWSGESFEHLDLRLVGSRLRFATDIRPDPTFARQELALGDGGQARLRRLRVGVVGMGGTGSVTAVQLAHLGVAEIVAMDGDLVEATNVPRIIGARLSDVGVTSKVRVFERYVQESGLPTKVMPIDASLKGDAEMRSLRSCDVILSCVDRHTPRALLNRLAYEALVPVIDMGTAFRVDTTGRMTASSGRVVVVGPGRPCLACWGHIDPEALRVEALPAAELAEQAAQGYVLGASVSQPSVIPFNTEVAGAAVVELLRLACDFDAGAENVERLALSFIDGTVRRNGLAPGAACRICRAQ